MQTLALGIGSLATPKNPANLNAIKAKQIAGVTWTIITNSLKGNRTVEGSKRGDNPYGNTQSWYQRVVATTGQQSADSFLRYWLVAGFGSETDNTDYQWQTLEALEAWVERQTAPTDLVNR